MKFILAHWDKVILGAALVIAALIMAVTLAGGGSTEEFTPAAPAKQVAAGSNEVDYAALLARVSAPTAPVLSPDILARPTLQRCTSCKKIQPRWAVICPECGVTVTYSEDSDGDGIPNEWERKYGLDWTDPSDAHKDIDGDGLTNLAEFKRGSNPKDPQDPNLIADEYKIVSIGKPVRPVMFVHYIKTSAGVTLQIRYKGGTKITRTGEQIVDGKTPVYKVGDFKEKMELVWNPQVNSSQRVDRSELAMTDLKTQEQFVMIKGMTNYETKVEAKLVNLTDATEVIVREGDTLELPKAQRQARVKALDDTKRHGVFTVGGISYTVPAE